MFFRHFPEKQKEKHTFSTELLQFFVPIHSRKQLYRIGLQYIIKKHYSVFSDFSLLSRLLQETRETSPFWKIILLIIRQNNDFLFQKSLFCLEEGEIVRNFALRKSETHTSLRSTFAIFFGEIALPSCHRQSRNTLTGMAMNFGTSPHGGYRRAIRLLSKGGGRRWKWRGGEN